MSALDREQVRPVPSGSTFKANTTESWTNIENLQNRTTHTLLPGPLCTSPLATNVSKNVRCIQFQVNCL